MDLLDIQVVADTVKIRGTQSGVSVVLRRDRTTKFDNSMFSDGERFQLKMLLERNAIIDNFGILKLVFNPIEIIGTKEGTIMGQKVKLCDSMVRGFLVTTNPKGVVVKLKKNGKTCRGGTEKLIDFLKRNL